MKEVLDNWSENEESENRRLEEQHAFTAPYKKPEDWVKYVVVIGAGDFGRETAEICKRIELSSRDMRLIGFLDDNKELHGKYINGIRVLGGIGYFKDLEVKPHFVVAIGDPLIKKRLIKIALDYGYIPTNIIDPSVIFFSGVKLGKGIVINVNCGIMANVVIKDHVHINLLTSVGHDVHIGAYSTISPCCALSGFTHIGKCCFLGSNVTTFPKVRIRDNSKIGAGSVVTKDIPSNVVAIGSPAKIMKWL